MQNKTKRVIDKKQLRKEILAVRDNMEKQDWQKKCRQLEKLLTEQPVFQTAKHILCYVNYRNEVETLSLIKKCLRLGKRVYCPLVLGKEMEFYEILSEEDLISGFRGILEPKKEAERLFVMPENETVLMIMPGAVFDKECHRIGYGGGYYDRYLEKLSTTVQSDNVFDVSEHFFTVALAFSFQIKEKIPYEEHDICPQMLVTENGIIENKTGRETQCSY